MERIVEFFPYLIHEYEQEKKNKHPYYIRVFEAIAAGLVCCYELENKRSKQSSRKK